MDPSFLDTTWIWHPDWQDHGTNTAGRFVHFRKTLRLATVPLEPLMVQITADTRYKLFVNSCTVITGPVKGDEHLWFYDEVNIQPYLKPGLNRIGVRVLRFFHATAYATSFPRLSIPGLFVRTPAVQDQNVLSLRSDDSWESAIDLSTLLRIDQKEDEFLHTYEDVDQTRESRLVWVSAKPLNLPKSHGISPPWVLSSRMIPVPRLAPIRPVAIHNIRSIIPRSAWEGLILGFSNTTLRLPPGTSHHVEIEIDLHTTALLSFRFQRPGVSGSVLRVRYSEGYEDKPEFVPYIRCKGDRTDTTKALYGPEDVYKFSGPIGIQASSELAYEAEASTVENFSPFHFRTMRYMSLDIQVAEGTDLEMIGISIEKTHYPLEIKSGFDIPLSINHQDREIYQSLWENSVRTLTNCMHDCYEDCPFYEQLQYAMDVRSSCLFTYAVSADDTMARQAITQLHNSYRPGLGLIASRSPAHQFQVIPHFSLFWICTVADHFEHYDDAHFTHKFLSTCDGILNSFARRIDPDFGLIASGPDKILTHWDFVDWTNEWRPMGIPPATSRTGFQTFTNFLYAYTLQNIATVVRHLGRPAIADEYVSRANAIVQGTQKHCRFEFGFTDGLAVTANPDQDFSQHNQIWAVLCGAVSGDEARTLIDHCLLGNVDDAKHLVKFTKVSTAMSHYALRALSEVGGNLYDEAFHSFWDPWRRQLAQNLTTWCEDEVTLRSDCHAWSSVPLYEFVTEVAGVRPLGRGWAAIAYAPRVKLFPSFDATVALGGRLAPGVARVSWSREANSTTGRMSMALDAVPLQDPVKIRITFPDGHVEDYYSSEVSVEFNIV